MGSNKHRNKNDNEDTTNKDMKEKLNKNLKETTIEIRSEYLIKFARKNKDRQGIKKYYILECRDITVTFSMQKYN